MKIKTKAIYLSIMLMGLSVLCILRYQPLLTSSNLSIEEINGKCVTEVKHVVFFKTHKTGGSSVQNLFMRFGHSRNLTFVLPFHGNYLGYPKPFEKSMAMELKNGLKYNIFALHARYNRKEIAKTMPNYTKYITLLRNPAYVFESAYSFYYVNVLLNMTLKRFVEISDDEHAIEMRNRRFHKGKIGRNQMSFDLGMEVNDFENQAVIERFPDTLDNDFDLVMIAEKLPESLILMKYLLCWTTFDIVIFRHNSRLDKFKTKITPELEEKILYWNKADKYLYDHFSAILDNKIEEFGKEKMEEELLELQKATDYWYDFCVDAEMGKKNLTSKNRVWSGQVLGFKSKHENDKTCQDLTKAELQFTDELQKEMRQYFTKIKSKKQYGS